MTGWTWRHVENYMTIPKLFALMAVWETHPPPAVCLKVVALANGMKEKTKTKIQKGAARDVAQAIG